MPKKWLSIITKKNRGRIIMRWKDPGAGRPTSLFHFKSGMVEEECNEERRVGREAADDTGT